MNHPDPDRRETVRQVLSALGHEQAELDEARFTAQAASDHAQEVQAMARAELARARVRARSVARLEGQLANVSGRIHGLQDIAAQAKTQAASSAAQTAAAAVAAKATVKAVEAVAAEVGAALNIATGALYGTEVQQHVSEALAWLGDTAGEVRRASIGSLGAAARSAEVIAGAVLKDVAAVQTGVDGLHALSQHELARITRHVSDAQRRVIQAEQSVSDTQARLAAAKGQTGALSEARTAIHPQLNFNLVVEADLASAPVIRVDAIQGTPHPPSVEAPQPTPECYLALVPVELAELVTLEMVEQLFARGSDLAPGAAAPLITIQPGGSHAVTVDHDVDLFGRPLVLGQGYVALLYVQPSRAYKQWLGDFSDGLSAPSVPFTVGKARPAAVASRDMAPLTGAEIPGLDTAQCVQAEISRLRIELDHAERQVGPLQLGVDALTTQTVMLGGALTEARASQDDVLNRLRAAADLELQLGQLERNAGAGANQAERAQNSVDACMVQMVSMVDKLTLALVILRKAAQRAGKAKQKFPLVPDDLTAALDKGTALGPLALSQALEAMGCCSKAVGGAARLKALMQATASQAQTLTAQFSGSSCRLAETSRCDNGQAGVLGLLQHEHDQIQAMCVSALDASWAAVTRLGAAQTQLNEAATRVGSLMAGWNATCAAAAVA